MSLKQELMNAGLGLTEYNFGNHCSGLYVMDLPGVHSWLRSNYSLPQNISRFRGSGEWEGVMALEIPFAFDSTVDTAIA